VAFLYGAEFKLDVGLYQLDQQVACQRIGNFLDANSKFSNALAYLRNAFMPNFAPALA
jgi:hypothetical protein